LNNLFQFCVKYGDNRLFLRYNFLSLSLFPRYNSRRVYI
jgi:hypothetical protein